jgi:7,8-dihydropterin-6-yl-methyl-4-(beta-D-ribofuranosyl)aminobenzene 5'-phosphate synthase
LQHLLEQNHDLTVYLPRSAQSDFEQMIKTFGANLIAVHEPLKICDGVYSTGELGMKCIEQSLLLQTPKGLIVITGCAHPGIVEIVQKAKELFSNNILFVMGGAHLGETPEPEIEQIIVNFQKLGVQYLGLNHCTGDLARKLFEKVYRQNFIPVGLGRVITPEDLG